MKKLFFIAVLFSSLLFSSCVDDLVDDLLDISFNTTITENYAVTVPGGPIPLIQSIPLNLDNADTSQYLDKLKSVEIKKMTYKIIDFSGDAEGKLTLNLLADDVPLNSITDINVKNAADAGTVFEVTDKTALTNAANSLLKNKTINLNTTGQAVSEGMSFKFLITLDLGVVANPL
jgi:hypothetical protein